MLIRRHLLLALPTLLSRRAKAEIWPDRPLRMIVPFPAGATPDLAGRAVATHFGHVLGQPCIVENRPGAGGNIGTDAIAKASDGHTIGVSINGPLATAPALYPNLPYDPRKDLAPISLLTRTAQVLVIHPRLPVQDLGGFVAYLKTNPEQLSFGSIGAGSGGHLAMLDLLARTGTAMLHVPYRGFPQATVDLLAGRIDAMMLIVAGILPQIREGGVRALAVTAESRLPSLPEVPSLGEAGLPDAVSYAWNGLVAPAGMPAQRVDRLARETAVALTDPASRRGLETAGFEVAPSTPDAFAALIAAEAARWGALIARLGIKPEA
jgi:tripartite-type tricarboxylate transporter receptor subunit TctC